jgi:hypothetical protein
MTTSHEILLSNLRVAVERDHRMRRRRLRLATAAIAVIVVGAATTAAATQTPWWQNAAPPVNPKVVDRQLAPGSLQWPASADRAEARTVAQWNGATLVAAPISGSRGGYCLIPALPGSPDIGVSCEYQSDDEVRAYARPGADPRWIIWGRFVESDAATIDLTPAVGAALKITLQPGGFFIADLPRTRWAALTNSAGSAKLLDGSGRTLADKCVSFGPSPETAGAGSSDTPSPLNTGRCAAAPIITGIAELAKARLLVQTTVEKVRGAAPTIALYEAPDTGGAATCFMIAPVPLPTNAKAVQPFECAVSPPTSPSHPISSRIRTSVGVVSGGLHYLICGWVDPSLNGSRVELQSLGGTLQLHYDHEAFLEEIPIGGAAYLEKPVIVVYDKSGHEVAREPVR